MAEKGTVARTVEAVGSDRLLEESIVPTWLNQRALTFWGFTYIWIGLAVVIVTFQYGANGVEAGYTVPTVLAVVWLATAALAILMRATADIGTEHGLSFAVYLRAPFGTVSDSTGSTTGAKASPGRRQRKFQKTPSGVRTCDPLGSERRRS